MLCLRGNTHTQYIICIFYSTREVTALVQDPSGGDLVRVATGAEQVSTVVPVEGLGLQNRLRNPKMVVMAAMQVHHSGLAR